MIKIPPQMKISTGTRLGPYEVISRIGAGGMGEVWRGRDTRLDRSVAIKLLLDAFGDQSKFRLRFEREARTISQLNHPNICTLYDIGQHDETSYIVMELIDGESLADRLRKGPLPLADVIKYGAQIADALDRAHRAGIVHRDLKPGNVMLARSGAKLLDFGLAKPQPTSIASHDETQKAITRDGTIVGTLQYMAPEQVEGQEADHRTDIFAFGALLYEMATGQRAFAGQTRSGLIAAILKEEPPSMAELLPSTPPALAHLVGRCLAKNPEDRWQSAHDIAAQLRWIAESTGVTGDAKTVKIDTSKRRPSLLVPWTMTALAITIAAFAFWRWWQVPPPRVTKTIVSTVAEKDWTTAPAISPDGRYVAYPASGVLWIRNLDEIEPRKVPLFSSVVFWSPDSKWLAFISDNKLWKIAPGGSTPMLIAALPRANVGRISKSFHSGAWGAGDRIVLSQYLGGLYETSARGGPLVEFLPGGPDLMDFHTLSFLPDGKSLLAVPHKLKDQTTVEVIRDKKRETILTFPQTQIINGIAYSPTGHLLVSLSGSDVGVWAVPFSITKMRTTGNPFLVAANAGSCTAAGDGALLYVTNIQSDPKQIVKIDRAGNPVATIGAILDVAAHPVLSPDERTLAVSGREGDQQLSVWLADLATGTRRRVTYGAMQDTPLSWSSYGRDLLIHRYQTPNWSNPGFGLWLIPINGSSEPRKIIDGWAGTFTPDNQRIAFLTFAGRGGFHLASMPVSGGSPSEIGKARISRAIALSPDGHFIAYTARDSGTDEVYLARYPSVEGKWQVSRGPGGSPLWSHDGRFLYFESQNRLMSVSFGESPEVAVGEPAMLIDATPLDVTLGGSAFQVLRDGSVIAIKNLPADKRQLILVQNWLTEFGEQEKP
jgi:serine/threonine protein kinase